LFFLLVLEKWHRSLCESVSGYSNPAESVINLPCDTSFESCDMANLTWKVVLREERSEVAARLYFAELSVTLNPLRDIVFL
jgi:hypothetical protein